MPDISTFWKPEEARGDWLLAGADLAKATDLETAVIISLFTDGRADPDDVIPDGTGNPRGWWGDTGRTRRLGSKLWLLDRAKETEETRLRAQDYCEAALAWLVEDGVAASVEVDAAWQSKPGWLGVKVTILEPDATVSVFNYQWAWKAVN